MELPSHQVGVLMWVHWSPELDRSLDFVVEGPEVSHIHLGWVIVADESNCN
jgi:hypothetical protein